MYVSEDSRPLYKKTRPSFLMIKSLGGIFFYPHGLFMDLLFTSLFILFGKETVFYIFMSPWCLCGHLHIKLNKAVGQYYHMLYKLPIHIKEFLFVLRKYY